MWMLTVIACSWGRYIRILQLLSPLSWKDSNNISKQINSSDAHHFLALVITFTQANYNLCNLTKILRYLVLIDHLGFTSILKISVGIDRVQQALGISTIPLILP
jgi:hypothetical protein